MNSDMTKCLRSVYEQIDIPADVLVTSPQLREELANEVRRQTGQAGMATQEIMHKLLRLRKAAGLPRLRR